MALRVAPLFAPSAIGRSLAASPDFDSKRRIALVIVLAMALFAEASGPVLSSPIATIVICAAFLGVGLPHGALDIGRIRGGARLADPQTLRRLALYVSIVAGMGLFWFALPVAALGAFMVMAWVHFADDWRDQLPPMLAAGTSIALLAAPAIFHQRELQAIFTLLSDPMSAVLIADFMLLVAPVAITVAAAGIALGWTSGKRGQAIEVAASLVGLLLLPPIAGFALYFCLSHSLTQFARARAEPEGKAVSNLEIAALSGASAAFAVLTLAFDTGLPLSGDVVVASFMTLSVLTAAHMAFPWIAPQRSRAIASLA